MTGKGRNGKAEQEQNPQSCFVLMPISDTDGYPNGHFSEVYTDLIKPAVEAKGYECSRADDSDVSHFIQLHIVEKVIFADLCVCDLSTKNPNVLFEIGMRQAFDKPTVLIRDDKTPRIFDLSGFRDIEYDPTLRYSQLMETRKRIEQAIEATARGADESNEVLSLIRMMRIASANLPQGADIDPGEAQFAVLKRQIDRLTQVVSGLADRQTSFRSTWPTHPDPHRNIASHNSKDSGNHLLVVNFKPDAVEIINPKGNERFIARNDDELMDIAHRTNMAFDTFEKASFHLERIA